MASLPDVICHYTSLSAFQNIIDGIKEGDHFLTFWASDVRTMNDPTEMKYGLEQAKKFIENWENAHNVPQEERLSSLFDSFKDQDICPNLYAISFSKEPNHLAMWNGYADNRKGIVIGIKDAGADLDSSTFEDCSSLTSPCITILQITGKRRKRWRFSLSFHPFAVSLWQKEE